MRTVDYKYYHFMQDDTTFNRTKAVQAWFGQKFEGKIIDKNLLSPRSPELNMMISSKDKVIVRNPLPKKNDGFRANLEREINVKYKKKSSAVEFKMW